MSQPIRVGFVGAGWMGTAQMHRLSQRDDVVIAALCERSEERGLEVLGELGLSPDILVTDYDKIVNNPNIDAVWLVSPNSFHAPQAIAALQAGKHVFSEKPSATTFADHLKQVELAKANPHLRTFVDYILYFDTFEQNLRERIAQGDYGTVTQIQVNYRHPVNIVGNKVWKLKRDIMGDAIGMGINHALSVMVLAMESQAKPVSVYATSMPTQVRGFEADPIWNIQVAFDNGASGFCFGNIDSTNGYDAYHSIYGTQGGLIFDSLLDRPQKVRTWSQDVADGKWIYPLDAERCEREGVKELAWPADTTTPDSGDVIEHQTGECVGHFIDCIKNQTASPLSFDNSAIIAEVGWAAQVSAITHQPVALPLDTELALKTLS